MSALTIFIGTLVFACLHFAGAGHASEILGIPADALISFLAGSLPAWGGALHGMYHLLDHAKIAHRSQRVAAIYAELAAKMEAAHTLEEICNITLEAEELSRTENAEWVVGLTHRSPILPV